MKHYVMLPLFSCVLLGTLWVFADQQPQGGHKEEGTRKIALASSAGGNWQIWVVNADGSDSLQLTQGLEDCFYPSWSPDGSRLVYADGAGRIIVLETGLEPSEQTNSTGKVTGVPTVPQDSANLISLERGVGGNARELPGLPRDCTHPAWSADGGKVAFACNTVLDRKEDSDIWIADLKEGRVWKLMEQPGIQKYPDWSPDGLTLAYCTGYRVSSTQVVEELWLVNADGSNPRRLVSNDHSNIQPDWSPNGNIIVFASDQSGNMDVWAVDKDGSNARQLTRDGSYDGDPSWSPEGSRICFTSTRGGKMDLWIMNEDGSGVKQVTGLSDSPAESQAPAWSP